MERRLSRSRQNRMFLGVCGGLGDYYRMDPVLVRVIWALITVASGFGPGIIAYFILALIIPLEGSKAGTTQEEFKENLADLENSSRHFGDHFKANLPPKPLKPKAPVTQSGLSFPPPNRSNRSLYFLAVSLITIGVFFIIVISYGSLWRYLWPLTLIAAGIIVVALVFIRQKPT